MTTAADTALVTSKLPALASRLPGTDLAALARAIRQVEAAAVPVTDGQAERLAAVVGQRMGLAA